MPLNLSVNEGDFNPYLKYNAKAGRFYVKGSDGGPEIEVEKPRLVFDMANIKTGWIYYQEGAGPEKVWDLSQTEAAPRPAGTQKWKRGFEVMVVGGDDLPGVGKLGLREFSSTASNVISAILSMHSEYEAQAAANPGKVPFYVCAGVNPIPGSYGTNYEPVFKLHSWIDRAKVPDLNVPAKAAPVAAPRTQSHQQVQGQPVNRTPARSVKEMTDDQIPF